MDTLVSRFFQRKCANTRVQIHRTRPATMETLVAAQSLDRFPFSLDDRLAAVFHFPRVLNIGECWIPLSLEIVVVSSISFHRILLCGADLGSNARAVS